MESSGRAKRLRQLSKVGGDTGADAGTDVGQALPRVANGVLRCHLGDGGVVRIATLLAGLAAVRALCSYLSDGISGIGQ